MSESNAMESVESRRPYKAVFTIVERGGRKFWVRIGAAFTNHDQSLSVKLDATPTNGQLHIREPDPLRRNGSDSASESFAGMGELS